MTKRVIHIICLIPLSVILFTASKYAMFFHILLDCLHKTKKICDIYPVVSLLTLYILRMKCVACRPDDGGSTQL
jgi:hypothetical protein